MNRHLILYLSIFLFHISGIMPLWSQIEVSKLFCDHMVLQREHPVPVWGWGVPDQEVHISFAGQDYQTRGKEDGSWMITIPAFGKGGPFNMNIRTTDTTITITDILIGDVWVCSGQSNMEWTVENSNDADEEIQTASDAGIRHFKVPRTSSYVPELRLAGGQWQVTSPQTVANFTAVGYFFAKNLRQQQDVPIGLLNSSWGGSRIEPWMRAELLGIDPTRIERDLKIQEEKKLTQQKKILKNIIGHLPNEDAGLVGNSALWANPDYDDSDWNEMPLPALWESEGLPNLDGVVWFRKKIYLDEINANPKIILHLGPIDDSDITWINGNQVGSLEQKYNMPRKYPIDASFLKAGENIVTVRVHDTGGGGGIYGAPSDMYLEVDHRKISLSGPWKFKVGKTEFPAGGSNANQVPTLLYNKMIHPIINFPIKGVIWYQGESNASQKDAYAYRNLFQHMISDWRQLWKVGDFPFLWVQLANFMAPDENPTPSDWAILRESQSKALSLSNTGQAVIIDIGEADDIHPRNKQGVGYRLSLAARKWAYGENINWSSPVYKNHWVREDKILVEFEHAGSGLFSKDKNGNVGGFAIAGTDKKFRWAQTQLKGNSVWVWHQNIPNPVAVRYAWGNNPDKANLYSMEGLPVCPFRTDNW